MLTGTVKWFNEDQGYGFITIDEQNKDVFVHYSGIVSNEPRKKLSEGQRVSFDIETDEKTNKEKAVNVTAIL